MPNNISLTINNETVSVEFPNLTNQQLFAAVRRIALVKGADVANMTAQEIGLFTLRTLVRYGRDLSLDRQRVELATVHRTTDDATLAADNDLISDE